MGIQNSILRSPNDLSEPQSLDQALKNWVQTNKTLNDIFLDAYCVVDLTNRVVDFNIAFTEICGESYRKILKIGDFCELLKTELCPHQCPAKQIVASQKSLRLDELKGASKAFTQLQLILSGIPILSERGEVLGSLLTIRNVSAENELQKKYDERKLESVTDGLTRLYNKTFAETALIRTVKSSLREVQSFSIMMCDIDHFKKVNDTYGHQAGDYVLSTVAQMLKGEARDTDIVGRYGGEEFMVILMNSTVEGAWIFGERFRNRIAATRIMYGGNHIPVTVSLGSATFNEKWKPGSNPERMMKELVNSADTALYFSKANGRNQTRQFESLPQQTGIAQKNQK